MSSLDPYREANRARWDESVQVHAASDFYGVDRFLAGESTLLPLDLEEVGDVSGKSLLHLQCHFGLDTLSWARLGANVVGVDFAPSAVETAREIAQRAGLQAEFAEAELYASARRALGPTGHVRSRVRQHRSAVLAAGHCRMGEGLRRIPESTAERCTSETCIRSHSPWTTKRRTVS